MPVLLAAEIDLVLPDLPALNATLNGLCTLLLLTGYFFIRRRMIRPHQTCMVTAFVVSLVFLASYLYYHIVVKAGEPTRFTGTGSIRGIYFAILVSHTVLAAVVAILAPITLVLGFRSPGRHRRLALWTFPIWLYVSLTGVVVYWMLYRLYSAV